MATAPTLDGRLDEPIWGQAQADGRFLQNFPTSGAAPSERTELRLLYDDRALYVGVRCFDRDPRAIVSRLTRRDRETEADKILISIDSRHDHQTGYLFAVNVAGVLLDGARFNDVELAYEWDGIWNARTSRDDGGWSAEIEIPWRTLRFAGSAPEMGFQVTRYLQRRGEVIAWASIPREVRGEVSRYGTLVGLSGLRPRRLLQLLPYVATRLAVRSDFGEASGAEVTPSLGADLKLGLTSSLTLDATLNPDFGQVEADQVNLNLTTFEIFYPEKRPFFLEGVDLFSTPIQQFYTRRVGRLDRPGGRIFGALKLSGQVVPHLSMSAIESFTTEPFSRSEGERAVSGDALANYAVLRLRSDFGQSFVGLTASAVNRFEQHGVAPPPELCPAGRCTNDAYSVGLDTRLATRDGSWSGQGQVLLSHLAGGPTRRRADGSEVKAGDTGFGALIRGGKSGGNLVLFQVTYEGYSPQLDLNDAGFVRRGNLHSLRGWLTFRSTRPVGRTVEINGGLFAVMNLNWRGDRLANEIGGNFYVRFDNFWDLYLEGGYRGQRYDDRETRDGALTERVQAWTGGFYAGSDPRRRVFGSVELWGAGLLRGVSLNGMASLGVRPLPQIELDIMPRFTWDQREPRWVDTESIAADGGPGQRYWFGDLTSQSFDVTLRGTYTFTPRLTLQGYAQFFLAGGHYGPFFTVDGVGPRPVLPIAALVPAASRDRDHDFRYGTINVNLVLRWEYLPGSTLIAVWVRSHDQAEYLPTEGDGVLRPQYFRGGPATDVLMMKLTYLWG